MCRNDEGGCVTVFECLTYLLVPLCLAQPPPKYDTSLITTLCGIFVLAGNGYPLMA
jgi:hypothetical protein